MSCSESFALTRLIDQKDWLMLTVAANNKSHSMDLIEGKGHKILYHNKISNLNYLKFINF